MWLTLRLAAVTTLVLLLGGTPLALWLAFGRSRARALLRAVVALPLVLPPTVLGFYLLLLLGPSGAIGGIWEAMGGERLVFSFSGLVIGSTLYSLPLFVGPLESALVSVDRRLLEAAATLGAKPLDRFFSVLVPLSRSGFVTAATLAFAHTIGEFGVVLMIGGSIPGKTKVLSIAVYEAVETMQYQRAHAMGAMLVAFSLAVLLLVYGTSRHPSRVMP
jgi:molybdate transport system permease protein